MGDPPADPKRLALELEYAQAAAKDLQLQIDKHRAAELTYKCRLEEALAYIKQLESARVKD